MPDNDKDFISAAVHQASGMVSEQVGCDLAEALVRLRTRAATSGRTLDQMAHAVLERSVRFEP